MGVSLANKRLVEKPKKALTQKCVYESLHLLFFAPRIHYFIISQKKGPPFPTSLVLYLNGITQPRRALKQYRFRTHY